MLFFVGHGVYRFKNVCAGGFVLVCGDVRRRVGSDLAENQNRVSSRMVFGWRCWVRVLLLHRYVVQRRPVVIGRADVQFLVDDTFFRDHDFADKQS